MGPTAVGKTAAAMFLYDEIASELISVDSAMIYRSMDIGSAKPSKHELIKYPHHLIDVVDPNQNYSVSNFCQEADKIIQQCFNQNKIPILVGGTMMYYKALQQGLSTLPARDDEIRDKLQDRASKIGWPAMHRVLSSIDEISAKRIHPNDPQRIARALEVFYKTGKPMSSYLAQQVKKKPYHFVNVSLMPDDRRLLHELIAERFMQMINQGFVDEVKALKENWQLNESMPSIRCVGYRQVWQYLQGEYDYQTMMAKAVAATRQLAKRQMTWLRSFEDITHFDPWSNQLKSLIMKHIKKHCKTS